MQKIFSFILCSEKPKIYQSPSVNLFSDSSVQFTSTQYVYCSLLQCCAGVLTFSFSEVPNQIIINFCFPHKIVYSLISEPDLGHTLFHITLLPLEQLYRKLKSRNVRLGERRGHMLNILFKHFNEQLINVSKTTAQLLTFY
jgi:hypothetical protein